jgi:hypothetical protein
MHIIKFRVLNKYTRVGSFRSRMMAHFTSFLAAEAIRNDRRFNLFLQQTHPPRYCKDQFHEILCNIGPILSPSPNAGMFVYAL